MHTQRLFFARIDWLTPLSRGDGYKNKISYNQSNLFEIWWIIFKLLNDEKMEILRLFFG